MSSQSYVRNHDSVRLEAHGWTDGRARQFRTYADEGLEPGRVVSEHRHHYTLQTADGELDAEIAGRLLHRYGSEDMPVVGDWVAFSGGAADGGARHQTAVIQAVLPRTTRLSRKVAGRRTSEQLVAANVETVFLVMGLDGDFNLRRLERLLVTVWESGARPVVVLNKSDLCADTEDRRRTAEAAAPGVPVLTTSCFSDPGVEAVRRFLEPASTIALMGSSGAGKSSLINRLAGRDLLATGAVRAGDDRGRHTTTHRQLVALPAGALLIDNPGIRELQLWSTGEAMGRAFEDLETLAAACRFRDCTHRDEPGCAVLESIADGRLDAGRLSSYHDLEKEIRALQVRRDSAARRAAGKKAQAMYRSAIKAKRHRRGW